MSTRSRTKGNDTGKSGLMSESCWSKVRKGRRCLEDMEVTASLCRMCTIYFSTNIMNRIIHMRGTHIKSKGIQQAQI